MIVELLLLSLVAAIIHYFFFRSKQPELFYNKDDSVSAVVTEMQSLKKKFYPTFWLPGGHLMTMWGMRFRESSKLKPEREDCFLEDGGVTILDWFPKKPGENSTIVIINHTLFGGTREPCVNNVAEALVKAGYVAVVANARGCSGAKVLTQKISHGDSLEDLDYCIDFILQKYNPAHLLMVGFSAGSIASIRYAEHYNKIEACVVIGHPYDAGYSTRSLHHGIRKYIYEPVIMQKMARVCDKSTLPLEIKDRVHNAKSLTEMDSIVITRQLNTTLDEYYNRISIPGHLNVNCPTLILAALDDPFTRSNFIPTNEALSCHNTAIAQVPCGGHVSFITGLDAKRSLIDDVTVEWFQNVLNQPKL